MEEIYSKIVELVEAGRPSVLATIIRLSGSGPRGAGTKILILEDGSSQGTIGGGLLEARVLEGARKVMETGSPSRFSMFLGGTDVARTDMICGGDVEVLLEPISPGSRSHLEVFRRVREIQRRGGSALLVTLLERARWQEGEVPKMLLQKGGETLGSILGKSGMESALRREMEGLLKRSEPAFITYRDEGGEALELFVEPVTTRPVLYVFGGGHVSMQIAPLARRVGFKVVIVDDRPEFADPGRWPEAEEVHQMPFAGALGKLPVDESSYLVIVTRGHIHDKTVLEQCLRSGARYVGMIGSRRKKALIYESLLKQGFTQADLDRVHAPIGLDIGAETPEEIAVSIVAELIRVRAGRD
ncbi:MAG: XdhC family aldehyde oxidoreductase maturation factor [Thermodesulfobacteriota bacterium]